MSLGFFTACTVLIATGVGRADGSIVSARLTQRLPAPTLLFATTALWFSICELLEPHHAVASPLAIVVALALAALLMRLFATALLAALTRIVIAIVRQSFSSRTPRWAPQPRQRPLARRLLCSRRRFARPPPAVSLHCA